MIYNGDVFDILKTIPDNSVDTVITDPPYGLGFMGKEWDTFDKSQFGLAGNEGANDLKVKKNFKALPRYNTAGLYDFTLRWASELLRVAKPGAILLSFGGTRTYHRIACAIEDAGWIIKDAVMWVYGSGYPKSYNIAKGINALELNGTASPKSLRVARMGEEYEPTGQEDYRKGRMFEAVKNDTAREETLTENAAIWDGWGTALKPAWEPICVAMKPIEETYSKNALKWGVAGMWIDGSKIPAPPWTKKDGEHSGCETGHMAQLAGREAGVVRSNNGGRWPANLIHDGSEEVVELFPESKGWSGVAGGNINPTNVNIGGGQINCVYNDSGSAARFFYCAKPSATEKNYGLDCYLTVKYNCDKSDYGGLLWKDVSMVVVQLLEKVTSDTAAVSFSTEEYGESIMAQCHKDSLSTTLTEINKITELKILNLLMHSLTSESTADASCETESGGSLAENVETLKKWILTTTNGCLELALGASSVALQTLLKIKDGKDWIEKTNSHPTIKPVALMRYLVRLTKTPTGGVVLDPFMGSGTTGVACLKEDREFIGIEKDEDYFKIASERLKAAELPLFVK